MFLSQLVLPAGSEWLALALSYLLGSVAFGLVIGFLKGVDIRRSGSGNVGATNAGRVLGRPFGLLAFAGDLAKGLVPAVFFGPWFANDPSRALSLSVLAGAAAVCGHVWPIFFRFRGGKAVATGCGVLVGLDPVVFLVGGAAWLVAIGLFRMVGLASLVMGFTFPIVAWWRGPGEIFWAASLLAGLILLRHRSNIARMLAGTEPRLGQSTKGTERA